jgi:hypothetical protein
MLKNTFRAVFPLFAAIAAAGLLLAPISCESSGPTTATGSGGPRAISQPPKGIPDGGWLPTPTPVGYEGPRPTPTAMPSNVPPTPSP